MDAEQQFQAAAQLFQSGDFSGAEQRLEALAQSVPGNPNILHLLSLARLRQDKAAAAADSLKELTALVPGSAEAHDLLGCALRQAGRINAAIRQFRKALAITPEAAQIHYNLGNAYRDDRQIGQAISHYRRAVELDPENLNALFNLGQAYFNTNDLIMAAETLHTVAIKAPNDLEAQCLLARAAFEAKMFALARTACESALILAPDNLEIVLLNTLCAASLADYSAAAAGYDRLLTVRPGDAALLHAKATILRAMGDAEGALNNFRQAMTAAPENMAHRAELGSMLERMNRIEEAWAVIEPGLAAEPGNPGLVLVAARLERRAGDDGKAFARLTGLSDQSLAASPAQGDIYFAMADHCDRIGRPGDAIENYEKANAFLARDTRAINMFRARSEEYLRRLKDAYVSRTHTPPAPAAAPDGHLSPIFVVGFPRSGTAQVERILSALPGFRVLAGTSALAAVRDRLLARGDGFPANLFTQPETEFASLRDLYFQAGDKLAATPEGRLVESISLNILDAGLIHRLFPDARFVHTSRHPFDTCLECFMHPFDLNTSTVHFTRLDDSVQFYEEVMNLWHVQRDALDITVHEMRFEDMIAQPKAATDSLLAFLGVEGSDHTDVSLPAVGDDALAPGDWRKYEIHMAPYLQRLRPFIKAFEGDVGG